MCGDQVLLTATAQNLKRQRRNDVAVGPLARIPDRFS
jgi:hypothetical protein